MDGYDDPMDLASATPADHGPPPASDGGGRAPPDERAARRTVTILLRGLTHTLEREADETIVQTAYRLGVLPPVSCLSGACGTCLATLTEGAVAMRANDVLTDDEIAQGYVLTCQAVPTTPAVTVEYDG